MMRYKYLVLAIFLIFSGSLKSQSKPNIILIITDDQRWDALGYAGNTVIETPEMDKLGSDGFYFKNAFASTPICAASRATLFSGLYERTHDYTFTKPPLNEKFIANSYPILLKKNGYYTGYFGKLGVNMEEANSLFSESEYYNINGRFPDRRGYFYKTLGKDTVHLTRYTGQKGIDFINQRKSSEPFCLTLSFSAPHAHDSAPDQYFWQEEQDQLLADYTIKDAPLSEDKYFEEQPDFIKNGFNRERWKWRFDTPEKYQHSVKGYYRMINGIDDEIGKIRKALSDNKLDQNTVIILIGDNGYFLNERQIAGKWLMYENSIRVPIIVYDPKGSSKDISEMVMNVDIAPTRLGYAGVSIPPSYEGKDLSIYSQNKKIKRKEIYIEHLWNFEHIAPSEGIRTEKWKYFHYINEDVEELYNLKKDPQEINNLIATKPKVAKKLLDQLRREHTGE